MLHWTHPSLCLRRHLYRFSSRQKVPMLYNGPPFSPSKFPLCVGGSGLSSNRPTWFLGRTRAHPSPHPKRNVGRFSGFCRVHDGERQTDRQTGTLLPLQQHAASTYVVLWCGVKNKSRTKDVLSNVHRTQAAVHSRHPVTHPAATEWSRLLLHVIADYLTMCCQWG